jgi:dTDP-glucose 4,6-dehydratase
MSDDVIVVTGGSGFVGSAVIRHLIRESEASVVNVDALTYAATPASLAEVEGHARYRFERIDIRSAPELERVFSAYRPTAVLHLAAETHVDRSVLSRDGRCRSMGGARTFATGCSWTITRGRWQ